MKKKIDSKDFDDQEIDRVMNAALKKALNTKPKIHEAQVAKPKKKRVTK